MLNACAYMNNFMHINIHEYNYIILYGFSYPIVYIHMYICMYLQHCKYEFGVVM